MQRERKSPDKAIEGVLAKWKRLTLHVAFVERRNAELEERLRVSYQQNEELRKELDRVRPPSTKWGWMYWPFRVPGHDIVSLEVMAPEDENERRLEGSRMRTMLSHTIPRCKFRVVTEREGLTFRIYKEKREGYEEEDDQDQPDHQ